MMLSLNEIFPDANWIFREDPHGVIPSGIEIKNQYTVIFFCAPAGDKLRDLMVGVKDISKIVPETDVYSTTIKYLSVLRDYFMQLSHDEFVDTVLWRKK